MFWTLSKELRKTEFLINTPMLTLNSNLLNYLRTASEVVAFSNGIATLQNELYHTKESFANLALNTLPEDQAAALIQECKAHRVSQKEPAALEKFLKDLQLDVNQLPVVILKVAISPTFEFKRRLVEWLRKSMKIPVLLDVVVSPDILGGVVILRDGNYYDYSVATKLNSWDFKI